MIHLLVLLFAGCSQGVNIEDFPSEYQAAICDHEVVCGELTDGQADACYGEVGTLSPGCAWDAESAADCMDGFVDLACEENAPAACTAVCGG